MQINNRGEIVGKLSRQIATFEGQIWDKLAPKRRAEINTLVASLLATVERLGGAKDASA